MTQADQLVEDGLITEDNFRDFTFANAVRVMKPADCSSRGRSFGERKRLRCLPHELCAQ